MTTTLPALPSLEQLKRQAKDLVKLFKASDPDAIRRAHSQLPRAHGASPDAKLSRGLKLSEAQHVLAREYGFSSWPKMKRHVEETRPDFEAALSAFKRAVQSGDQVKLRTLLRTVPALRDQVNSPLFSFDSPAIRNAADRQDREMVDLLIRYGADVNARSQWWAGGFGVLDNTDPGFAEFLIERGASVDIWAAAGLNRLGRLTELLDTDPAMVNARGGDGGGPLHFAGSIEVARLLLDRGADIDMRDIDHESTPAQWMAAQRPEICAYLITRGAEVDIFMAVQLGDAALVQRALEADPESMHACVGEGNLRTTSSAGGHIYMYSLRNGRSPLLLAAELGSRPVFDILAARSSDVDRLIASFLRVDEAQVSQIVAANPDIVRTAPPDRMRAIADAAWAHKTDAVRLMLKFGFDIEALGDHQSTALNRAAVRGFADLIELLLSHGASLEAKNEFGGRPLSACIWGADNFRDPNGDYVVSVQKLLTAGAPLSDLRYPCDHRQVNGVLRQHLVRLSKSNIIAAIKLGDESRVEALLDRDSGLVNRPSSSMLPLCEAIRSRQSGISRLLLARGASPDQVEQLSGTTARELAAKGGGSSLFGFG